MANLDTLYAGELSDCCEAELIMKTDGDADWFECSQCGEPSDGIEKREEYKLRKDNKIK